MISLPKPDFGLEHVVGDLSSSDARVEAIRTDLISLLAHQRTYEQLGDRAELHEFSDAVVAVSEDLQDTLRWAYGVHLRDGEGRRRYNNLRGAVAKHFKKCPLCLVGAARPLDHHLPKAHFGSLSMTPLNLVPMCDFCNTKKRSNFATFAEVQPLHPYFDTFASAPWLVAEVEMDGSPALLFGVHPDPEWSVVETARVRNHFVELELQDRYSDEAMQALSGLVALLEGYRSSDGAEAVRAELTRQAASERLQPLNAVRAAALEAWARSDWFVDAGVRGLWLAQEALRLDVDAA
jgi:hypothetical protein